MYLRHAVNAEKDACIAETAKLLSTLSPRQLAERKLAVLDLYLNNVVMGFGDKFMLQLGPDRAVGLFNPSVSVRDKVQVFKQPHKSADFGTIIGTVVKITKYYIVVACNKMVTDLYDNRLWLVKLVPEEVFRRMIWAVRRFEDRATGPLLDIVKGRTHPQVGKVSGFKSLGNLNESQKDAVQMALGSELCVIHGPPGTGKTVTLTEIIRQLVARGERVLVCGPSNIAVDNIVVRLAQHMRGVLRLGNPARQLEEVAPYSLDLIASKSDDGIVLEELGDEIEQVLGDAKKARGPNREALLGQLELLLRKYRYSKIEITRNLILHANVVAATLHGAGAKYLRKAVDSLGGAPLFNTIIIDEVAQSLLPQCYIPLVVEPNAQRLVIAGDNRQLPPLVKSRRPKVIAALKRSLFDILIGIHGPEVEHLINVQYRMPREIMEFPSRQVYGGKLKAHESNAKNRLYQLKGVQRNKTTETVVLWVDTSGDMHPEQLDKDTFSHKNPGEAELVADYVLKLLESGVKCDDIGVISPYRAQVSELRKILPAIEVSTVDGFQGREKEVILISLVRSNSKKEVGFLGDARRMNVALTRAKRQLVVFGNSKTIGKPKGFLKNWTEWCQKNAEITLAGT